MDGLPLRLAATRPQVEPTAPAGNFAGLDAIRACAALGVVLLHAGVPYLKHPMPGLVWPVRDIASPLVDVTFWTIELFIMPVFLVLAGFLAWRTLERRGAAALLKTRVRRLLVPLIFGIVVVLPLDLYAWVLGWVAEGIAAPGKLKSLKFDGEIDRDLWGLSHLWFLQYLFLYVAVVTFFFRASKRHTWIDRITHDRFVTKTSTIATALLVIAAVTLCFRPEVVWGFQHAFVPVPSKWIYSGTFFAGGLLIGARDPKLAWLQSILPPLLAFASVLAVAAVALGRWYLAGGENGLTSTALATLTVLGATATTLCIISAATKHVHRVSTTVGYLAAASFWIYLVHHPILGIVHLDLKWLCPTLPSVLKFVAAFGVSTSLALLSYEGLVRKTPLGRWLGFAWSPPAHRAESVVAKIAAATQPADDSAATDIPHRRAA